VRAVSEVPPWLLDVAECPEDRGPLRAEAAGLRCAACGRAFPVDDGVLVLLPDRLAHLREPSAGTGHAVRHDLTTAPAGVTGRDLDEAHASTAAHRAGGHRSEPVRWIEDELRWWNPWHERESLAPLSASAGLRGRSRERNLLRHIRPHLPSQPLVVEMGAGTSRTVAGLLPPRASGVRYVATDVSPAALRRGRKVLGADVASVQCDAVTWPMRDGVADLVLVLGVLHHLSDWRRAIERACRVVRPGGFLALHEVVAKPRVLARWRSRGLNDDWVSPHEGDVPGPALRAELERHGQVVRAAGEESPLRFALVRYLVHRGDRYHRLEGSPALTAVFNALDQLWGRGPGRLFPSLGFHETTIVWRRPPAG
jgi:SAM-dependent methyltransferase